MPLMNKPQNLKNHASNDPWFHFVLFGVLLVNLLLAIAHNIHHPGIIAVWILVLSLAALIVFVKLRTYPLKVQDRVIRLEERLRIERLLPAESARLLAELTEDQLIGLRFAADDEYLTLANAAINEHLTRKQIKQRIQNWRADYFRI